MLKRTLIYLLAIVVVAVSLYFIDKKIRCKKDGLDRNDAFGIANKKLGVDFTGNDFALTKEHFEDFDKSWSFSYSQDGCFVIVIVDRCGGSDIGGITAGCIPLQKP